MVETICLIFTIIAVPGAALTIAWLAYDAIRRDKIRAHNSENFP